MNARELLATLREAVGAARTRGAVSVTLDEVDRYLDAVAPAVDATRDPPESAPARPAIPAVGPHDAVATFQSVVHAGMDARRSSTLINGGAAVTLLALIGHLATLEDADFAGLPEALMLFVAGLLCGAVASGAAYAAQASWYRRGVRSGRARVANGIAIVLVLASYLLFAIGCYRAYDAFWSLSIPFDDDDPTEEQVDVRGQAPAVVPPHDALRL